jgi:hypothetical protein
VHYLSISGFLQVDDGWLLHEAGVEEAEWRASSPHCSIAMLHFFFLRLSYISLYPVFNNSFAAAGQLAPQSLSQKGRGKRADSGRRKD